MTLSRVDPGFAGQSCRIARSAPPFPRESIRDDVVRVCRLARVDFVPFELTPHGVVESLPIDTTLLGRGALANIPEPRSRRSSRSASECSRLAARAALGQERATPRYFVVEIPPSTGITAPVTYEPALDAR